MLDCSRPLLKQLPRFRMSLSFRGSQRCFPAMATIYEGLQVMDLSKEWIYMAVYSVVLRSPRMEGKSRPKSLDLMARIEGGVHMVYRLLTRAKQVTLHLRSIVSPLPRASNLPQPLLSTRILSSFMASETFPAVLLFFHAASCSHCDCIASATRRQTTGQSRGK
jgi:hypothetical protein